MLTVFLKQTWVTGEGEGGQQRLGYPQLISHALLPQGPDLLIGGGGGPICILFAYQLCEFQDWPRALESPWLPLPPLWFPHLPESLRVASCVATAGEGGVQMLATGFPRTHRAPSALHPVPRALLASLVWGAWEASPEALWEAPGWLRAGSNRAQGLLPLCLPKRGPPLRATQRESLGPSPAHRGLARAAPSPPPLRPQRRPGAQRQWAGEGLSPPTGAK